MQYILFSMILIITLFLGIGIGLLLPIFILKFFNVNIYNKEEKIQKEEATTNITPDIMDEWFNGKGGN